MRLASLQVNQITGVHAPHRTRNREVDAALDALHADLTRRRMLDQPLAGEQDDAHDLELLRLQDRRCLALPQARAERQYAYQLSGVGMRLCHGGTSSQNPDGTGRVLRCLGLREFIQP
jgi:hypothetical protein